MVRGLQLGDCCSSAFAHSILRRTPCTNGTGINDAWQLPRALGYSPPHVPGAHLIAAVFGTIVFFYGGWPFIRGAIRELRARLPGMMTLIALAISVAFVFSAEVALGYPGMPLWEELATPVTMLLGHWNAASSSISASLAVGCARSGAPFRSWFVTT